MSLRALALRPTELKTLSRAALLLLAARCALRSEPWIHHEDREEWLESLRWLLLVAAAEPVPSAEASGRRAELSNLGAANVRNGQWEEESDAECANYAWLVLAEAVSATSMLARPALVKAIIDSAKLSASIGPILGHAGRIRSVSGEDPVDAAMASVWAAIRSDLPLIAVLAVSIHEAADAEAELRGIGPLWPDGAPEWASLDR